MIRFDAAGCRCCSRQVAVPLIEVQRHLIEVVNGYGSLSEIADLMNRSVALFSNDHTQTFPPRESE